MRRNRSALCMPRPRELLGDRLTSVLFDCNAWWLAGRLCGLAGALRFCLEDTPAETRRIGYGLASPR